ncbi:MAG: DUF4367 domain-containing protein [Bacillota bacterium]
MLTDRELDMLIKEAVRQDIDSQEVPPDAKERVRERLGLTKKKKPSGLGKTALVASVILVLFACAYVVLPGQATAFSVGLIKRLEIFLHESLYNISERYGSSKQKFEQPPPQAPEIAQETEVSLDEARLRLPFNLMLPKYLPEGFQLRSIRLYGKKPVVEVTLRYIGPNGLLVIKQKGITDNTASGFGYDVDDTKVKRIDIHGVQATLLENESGQSTIVWHHQGVNFKVEGMLSPEEIIRIAKSLTP